MSVDSLLPVTAAATRAVAHPQGYDRPKPLLLVLGLMLLLLQGCSTSSRPVREQRLPSQTPSSPYLRVSRPQTNVIALQVALRRFVPETDHGPAV